MKIAIYGAGGHGKVVYDALVAEGKKEVIGFIDDNKSKGEPILDSKILGGIGDLEKLLGEGKVDGIITAFADIQEGNILRKETYEKFKNKGLKIVGVIHPNSIVSNYAEIDSTSQIFSGAIISAGSKIGKGVIVNHNVSIDHDCKIGDYTHIAPSATLCGNVQVKDQSYIGAGSTIKEKIKIGENSIVGMGSVVVKDVPNYSTVIGVPAKLKSK